MNGSPGFSSNDDWTLAHTDVRTLSKTQSTLLVRSQLSNKSVENMWNQLSGDLVKMQNVVHRKQASDHDWDAVYPEVRNKGVVFGLLIALSASLI